MGERVSTIRDLVDVLLNYRNQCLAVRVILNPDSGPSVHEFTEAVQFNEIDGCLYLVAGPSVGAPPEEEEFDSPEYCEFSIPDDSGA